MRQSSDQVGAGRAAVPRVPAGERGHAHDAGDPDSRGAAHDPAITVWLSRTDLAALVTGRVPPELRAHFRLHLDALGETPAESVERWHILGEVARAR